MGCVVLFGGTGFIGTFLAAQLAASGLYDAIYLFDLEAPEDKPFPYRRQLLERTPGVSFVRGDVRVPIDWTPDEPVALAVNLAAVHREPGHEDHEYYDTNLRGAEQVTAWAVRVGCHDLIFTSSISPYGVSEDVKDEQTLPVPVTAYGGSKLVAEKIHQCWQAGDARRRLTIARPGVVFGPGEGGNVTRLIRAVRGRYFFYMGNRETRKAGIYVKELCHALLWVYQRQVAAGQGVVLFNAGMNPGPSIQEYVEAVADVAGMRARVPAIPYRLLLAVAHGIDLLARPLGIRHPFSPVRIRKLVRSNHVLPGYLTQQGYAYRYTLREAFQDWRDTCPQEWA